MINSEFYSIHKKIKSTFGMINVYFKFLKVKAENVENFLDKSKLGLQNTKIFEELKVEKFLF